MNAVATAPAGVVRSTTDVLGATQGTWASASAPLPSTLAGVSIDSRTLRSGELFVAIAGEHFDGHEFLAQARARGAGAALVHRDVAPIAGLPLVRVPDTTRALGALAHYVRQETHAPVIAITGSVGKTTTKEMTAGLLAGLGAVLKTEGNLNNRYGLPLSLLRLAPEHRAVVLELGMNHAGELRELTHMARPDIAVITLVAPVHLEFFDSIEAIAAAKAEILEGLGPQGVAILNHDDPLLRRHGQGRTGRVVWFGRERSCEVSADNWRGTAHGMRFDLRLGGKVLDVALPFAGPHNVANFLAAAAAAHVAGVAPEAIAALAAELRPAPHRGELKRLRGDVALLDDCYNSNPAAVEAAVVALGMAGRRRRVAFLGDMLELGPRGGDLHRETGRKLAGRVDVVVGVGALASEILAGARGAGLAISALHHFPDSAAAAASDLVQAGDAVLVKGSRGVQMERVVNALVARFGVEVR